jgi:hypothetical protein
MVRRNAKAAASNRTARDLENNGERAGLID